MEMYQLEHFNTISIMDKERENIRESVKKELAESQNFQADKAAAPSPNQISERFNAEKEAIIKQKESEFENKKQALLKQHEGLNREREALASKHQEDFRSQKLQFGEQSAKKIEEQVKNAGQLAEKRGTVKLNMTQLVLQFA